MFLFYFFSIFILALFALILLMILLRIYSKYFKEKEIEILPQTNEEPPTESKLEEN